MSKSVEGYYKTNHEPIKVDDPTLNRLLESVCSHSGWICPHCGKKSDVWKEEMNNDTYYAMLHEYEPLKMVCHHCDKEYYLKCHMTLKYSTWVDESFGDKDEDK